MDIRLTSQKDVEPTDAYTFQIYGGTVTLTGKELLRLKQILEVNDAVVEEMRSPKKKKEPV